MESMRLGETVMVPFFENLRTMTNAFMGGRLAG